MDEAKQINCEQVKFNHVTVLQIRWLNWKTFFSCMIRILEFLYFYVNALCLTLWRTVDFKTNSLVNLVLCHFCSVLLYRTFKHGLSLYVNKTAGVHVYQAQMFCAFKLVQVSCE